MSRYLLLLLFCLLPLVAHAADTRGLRVVAKDPATNQTAEVKLLILLPIVGKGGRRPDEGEFLSPPFDGRDWGRVQTEAA